MQSIRIATRESKLAMWQANHVADLLRNRFPELEVIIVGMTTAGDRNKVTPLAQMGGKGVFVKELEVALLEGRADIAVHSMKDVPAEMPDGLGITGICERADPRDSLVANNFGSLADMPAGARVGSSSLRRRLQLAAAYPNLDIQELRGNVDTRLGRLDAGDFDGIILAAAGLERLGLGDRITEVIDTGLSLPAAGQGAVGIESRLQDDAVNEIVSAITHADTYTCVTAERAMTSALGATCNLPIGAFAVLDGDEMHLSGFVGDSVDANHLRDQITCPAADGAAEAASMATRFLENGADRLIAS